VAHAVLALVTLVTLLADLQVSDLAKDDLEVYRAVLASKIRPQVDRFSAGAHIPTPAPVLTFDHTIAICRSDVAHPKALGCIREEHVQFVQSGSARTKRLPFAPFLDTTNRRQLAEGFRARNNDNQPFPGNSLDAVIAVSADALDEARKRESSRTLGFSSFSLPAYSADGHALVYASYVCGGLCGSGWLFLLERRADSWQVVAEDLLWIS
jgi:hypothetical protein